MNWKFIIQNKSSQSRFWKNFKNQKLALFGSLFLLVIILFTVFCNIITSNDPNDQGDLLKDRYLNPSSEHLFGTDKFGRDIFSRVLYGGRISLAIALSVVLLSMTIGIFYGTIAGYFGGFIDAIMMRFLDFWLAFPAIFLIMTIIAIFRPSPWFLIPLLGFTGWMEIARIIRAEVLSLKSQDFILAAKGLGLRNFRVLIHHLLPNCLNPIIVAAPLKVAEMILLESALSFLGIGIQPPMASWGSIINDGRDVLLQAWWVSTFPGIFIIFTVMSFNLIGEGIRASLGFKK